MECASNFSMFECSFDFFMAFVFIQMRWDVRNPKWATILLTTLAQAGYLVYDRIFDCTFCIQPEIEFSIRPAKISGQFEIRYTPHFICTYIYLCLLIDKSIDNKKKHIERHKAAVNQTIMDIMGHYSTQP